jgi:hypothetical protein
MEAPPEWCFPPEVFALRQNLRLKKIADSLRLASQSASRRRASVTAG